MENTNPSLSEELEALFQDTLTSGLDFLKEHINARSEDLNHGVSSKYNEFPEHQWTNVRNSWSFLQGVDVLVLI